MAENDITDTNLKLSVNQSLGSMSDIELERNLNFHLSSIFDIDAWLAVAMVTLTTSKNFNESELTSDEQSALLESINNIQTRVDMFESLKVDMLRCRDMCIVEQESRLN